MGFTCLLIISVKFWKCATLVLFVMISRSFELNSFCQTLDLWQSTLYLAYFRFLNWFEYSETTLVKRCFSPSTWAISLELWRCCCWPFTKITWKLSNAGVCAPGFVCFCFVFCLFTPYLSFVNSFNYQYVSVHISGMLWGKELMLAEYK